MKNVFLLFSLFSLFLLSACGVQNSLTIKGGTTSSRATDIRLPWDHYLGFNRPSTHGTPTMLNLSLYAVYISPNTDCTGAVLAGGDPATSVTQDMFQSPTLVTGSPANGTYKCIVFKMKDVMTFKVDATGADGTNAGCTNTTTLYTFDIHRTGDVAWKNLDGTTSSANGTVAAPVADDVFIYASMDTAAVTSGAIGAHPYQIVGLTSPLIVPGQGTMTINATNQVSDNGGHCWLEQATFGFH